MRRALPKWLIDNKIDVGIVGFALAGNGFVAWATEAAYGSDMDGWHQVLRHTVRFSALFFVLAFSARSATKLWSNDISRFLSNHVRAFGLGFVGAHLVHLFAVQQYLVLGGRLPRPPALAMDGVAVISLVTLAALSNDWAVRRLGIVLWKRIMTPSVYVLWFTLFIPFVSRIRLEFSSVPYWTYSMILLVSLAIRWHRPLLKLDIPGRASTRLER